MEKKKYMKPSQRVVELRTNPQLLQASGGLNGLPGYGNGSDPLSN